MPSSATASNRLQKPAAGEQVNVWGTGSINVDLDLIDASIDGWLDIALTANTTLTSVNYAADQARVRMLHFTGTGAFTVTAPGVSKNYIVWNALTGVLTFSNGTASVTIQSGETVQIATDGTNNFRRVQPTDFGSQQIHSIADPTSPQDAATKNYADNLAFTANAGILPGQAGNAGLFLSTNAAVASWKSPFPVQASHAGQALLTDGAGNLSWAVTGLNGQRTIVGADTVILSDKEKLLRCSGTFALAITAPTALLATFGCYLQNTGTGNITLTPASGTIDGLASYIMYPGEVRMLFSDGTNLQTIVLNPFYRTLTTSDAGFIWPPGYSAFSGIGWGAGGGGGGNGVSSGGGAAGFPFVIPASQVTAGATAALTVAAATPGSTGASPTSGGNSSVGALVVFKGSVTGAGGAAGGISFPAYDGGAGQVGGTGPGTAAFYGAGGGGSGANVGGGSIFGGAGGAGSAAGAGVAGTAPGGGGGGSSAGVIGGTGARGEIRMWGII